MTRFLLIRHALKDTAPDQLPGRTAGIGLSAAGVAQAANLAEALQAVPIAYLLASPLLRAQQTAQTIGVAQALPVITDAQFQEVEIGRWTGRTIDALTKDPEWKTYNQRRSLAAAPSGETMIEVQARFVSELLRLARQNPGKTIAVISHADPIRSALLYFLNRSLDDWASLEIDEATVSILDLDTASAQVVATNLDASEFKAAREIYFCDSSVLAR